MISYHHYKFYEKEIIKLRFETNLDSARRLKSAIILTEFAWFDWEIAFHNVTDIADSFL